VLVVEDDDDVRSHTTEVLRELGYRVLEAANGPAALDLLARGAEVRLLFTDVGLPGGMTGRQLAREVRLRWPGLKVLYTTGYAHEAIAQGGVLDPGTELLPKPFTYADLSAKIRSVLEG
jgi:CheY-like chemotaxis protein